MSIGVTICKRLRSIARAGLFVAFCSSLAAQEAPTRKVAISFLPPPLEGTISLGIYDAKGTLVRVLHREAEVEDFEVGADALRTTWDGKNDAGVEMPPGEYAARGYAVAVEVDGVGFFFNDFVTDENSPHIRKVRQIAFEDGKLVVDAEVGGAQSAAFWCDDGGRIVGVHREFHRPSSPVGGKDGTTWVLEKNAGQTQLKQVSKANDTLRQMILPSADREVMALAASTLEDRIFLLEQNATLQCLRALTLAGIKEESGQRVSDWKVEFEKRIVAHKDFTLADGKPVTSGGKPPLEKARIKLQPNALQKDAPRALEIGAGFDATGSFLKSADGLPLVSISETPHLTRVVLSPKTENQLDVFQDDEAVVEQFAVTKLDHMMAFDAGKFELK